MPQRQSGGSLDVDDADVTAFAHGSSGHYRMADIGDLTSAAHRFVDMNSVVQSVSAEVKD